MDGGKEIGGATHRFTVFDYHRMAEAGVFEIDARIELIRGVVVDMPAIGTPHLWTVNRLNSLLVSRLVGRAIVSIQNSIRLGEHSEPEPDVALLAIDADQTRHPGPADVLLVIEVADSTIGYDRATKGPLYAEAGIAEYWIVNLPERVVEVHREPLGAAYQQIDRVASGALAIQALPGVEVPIDRVFS